MKLKKTWFLAPIIIAIFTVVFSCSNPLLTQMQERITEDVQTHLAGANPAIRSVAPGAGEGGIPTSAVMEVEFDIDLDAITITSDTVKLLRLPSLTPVSGTVAYHPGSKTVTFTPDAWLALEVNYRLLITTGVKSAKGAPLSNQFTSQFTTRYFHDDEIGIDLTYSSADYQLNLDEPIHITLIKVPYPYEDETAMVVIDEPVITSSGKYRITIPWEDTSQIVLTMEHTILDNDDTTRYVKIGDSGHPNNSVEEAETADLVEMYVDENGDPTENQDDYAFIIFNEQYVLSIGNGYSVIYQDGTDIPADDHESLDDLGINHYYQIGQGVYNEQRNLHTVDDIDFIKFTPATSDKYEIRINKSPHMEVQLRDSSGTQLPLGTATGSGQWVLNPGGHFLTGGETYYLRIHSPTNRLGWYEIGYFFAPAGPDAREPGNNNRAGAVQLYFGRENVQTQVFTFHEHESVPGAMDADWFKFDLIEGTSYVVEVREKPDYFNHFDNTADPRNMAVDFRLEAEDGATTTANFRLNGSNTFFIPDLDEWTGVGAGSFYLKVENATEPIGIQRPSMEYSILLTYGPDFNDQANNPATGLDEYEVHNEHGPSGVEGTGHSIPDVARGTTGFRRTIYSTLAEENPEDDIDWFRVQSHNNMTEYLIRTEPEDGMDEIVVEFDLFNAVWDNGNNVPNLASGPVVIGDQTWNSDPSIRGLVVTPYKSLDLPNIEDPTPQEGTFFIRVKRSSTYPDNPKTGAYRLFFQAGADQQDNERPDRTLEIEGQQYGFDETPWIGKPFGGHQDFGDNNKLADSTNWFKGGSTPTRYHSIFKSNYNISTGEPDVPLEADHDFFWVEIPHISPSNSVNLNIMASYENPGMPVKVTVYRVPASGVSAEETIKTMDTEDPVAVVTESELGDPLMVYEGLGHNINETITGLANHDVLFIRIERDSENAEDDDPETTEYSIRLHAP